MAPSRQLACGSARKLAMYLVLLAIHPVNLNRVLAIAWSSHATRAVNGRGRQNAPATPSAPRPIGCERDVDGIAECDGARRDEPRRRSTRVRESDRHQIDARGFR